MSRVSFAERAWKARNLKEALEEMIELMDDGHDVFTYTDWHWRINGIDVWPSVKKFKKRGRPVQHYEKLSDVLK